MPNNTDIDLTLANAPYVSPTDRELQERDPKCKISLSAWVMQQIVLGLLQDHFLRNPAMSLGIPIQQQYSLNPVQSSILLDIGHNWNGIEVGSRPAFFIFRDDVRYTHPVIGHLTGIDAKDSEEMKLYLRSMTVSIACIGKTVGFAELLAEYAKIPFITFAETIRRDFRLRRFRISGISKPQLYKEGVNNYIVVIMLEISFDEGYTICRDDLKLKTVSRTIFDAAVPNVPLSLQ